MAAKGKPKGWRSYPKVRERHRLIFALREANPIWPLKALALATGLKDHSSVLYHLSGDCRCAGGMNARWFAVQRYRRSGLRLGAGRHGDHMAGGDR